QPDRVDPEFSEIGQSLTHAVEIADAVRVGILKGARVDLVEDAPLPPQPFMCCHLLRPGHAAGNQPSLPSPRNLRNEQRLPRINGALEAWRVLTTKNGRTTEMSNSKACDIWSSPGLGVELLDVSLHA